jgi:hypothetical protein
MVWLVRSYTRRHLAPALGLFFLAPLVAEFLLGNLPITWLWLLPVLALLYGGGALLIREVARRLRLGWAGLVVFGLAFGVIEEAFVTQSLFNPDYLGLRLLDFGYLPALGIGAWWTVFVLGLHTVWSTAVPIALVEALTPGARRTPWLGPFGLGLNATLFAVGCLVVARAQPAAATHASATQLVSSAAVIVVLLLAGFVLGRRQPASPNAIATSGRSTPSPLVVGTTAFACGSAFMAIAAIVHAALPAAASVTAMLAALAALAAATARWSHRLGWSERHRLAVAGGLLLTYAWYGFVQKPSVGHVSPQVDLLGNAALTAAALGLLVSAISRVAREPSEPA